MVSLKVYTITSFESRNYLGISDEGEEGIE